MTMTDGEVTRIFLAANRLYLHQRSYESEETFMDRLDRRTAYLEARLEGVPKTQRVRCAKLAESVHDWRCVQ
jgi:hypothetical protein